MKLLKREIFGEIAEWLERPEYIILTGSRQVGKTTLLHQLMNYINTPNKVYYDLENNDMLDICNSGIQRFLQYLRLSGFDTNNRLYVFIDEIQYLRDPSNFLKLLHDHHKNIKIIASGSSSLEIRKKFSDSLVGRKIVFKIHPFSFAEFLEFKRPEKYGIKKRVGNIGDIINGNFNEASGLVSGELEPEIEEYLLFGGYPRQASEESANIKTRLLNEIKTGYVNKDIRDIAEIKDMESFNRLLKVLASQIGGLTNIRELSSFLGISIETVKRYLFLLENTFIISALHPYFENKKKEISKMPKIFFSDNGLRNSVLGFFGSDLLDPDRGKLIENFIFTQLSRVFEINESLFFWRTQVGTEVDFIIKKGKKPIPVEVKASGLKKSKVTRSFRSFIEKYNPEIGIVFNRSLAAVEKIDGCRVIFAPWYAV
jgi:predicted AAA+ superfamily ATPase